LSIATFISQQNASLHDQSDSLYGHHLTTMHNFKETVSGEPLHQGIKRKRGAK